MVEQPSFSLNQRLENAGQGTAKRTLSGRISGNHCQFETNCGDKWFKVHHPLAFYAAYFYRRSRKGGFDAAMMTRGIDEVKAHIAAIDGNDDTTDKNGDLLTTLEVVYEFYLRGFRFAPMDLRHQIHHQG